MRMEKSPPIHGVTADCKPLTTFVHTNSSAFMEVVQRLTGPSEPTAATTTTKVPTVKKTTTKLHERRKCMKPKLEIVKPTFQYKSGSGSSSSLVQSPTTPSTIFSRLTLVVEQDEKKEDSAIAEINSEEEEKAIRERRFYLHPSPRSKQGFSQPKLLTLFPMQSSTTIP